MFEFFEALAKYQFLQNAILAALLASISCGITGSFVVKKKMTFVSGGIAHAVMGGIGIAYFLQMNTILGMLIFALFFALIITIAKINANQNEDTLIGVLWAIGMSIGIIFMYITPGYNIDLISFIFGNILMVESKDIIIMLGMDLVIIITTFFLYYHFLYISFDEDYLKVRGLKVNIIYFLLLAMISLTVVILIKIVGLILVIALLTLPAVIASIFSKSMSKLMLLSIVLSAFFTLSGIMISYQLDLPSSACIILFAGVIYLLSLVINSIKIKR